MALGMRHIVWFSATLSLGAFLYVLALEPMDVGKNPRAAALDRGEPSHGQMVSMVRRSMAQGQMVAADRVADRLARGYPQDPEALFYRALVDRELGREDESVASFNRLLSELETPGSSEDQYDPERIAYFHAWAYLGVGAIAQGQSMFAQLADELETGLTQSAEDWDSSPRVNEQGFYRGSGRDSGVEYNLACYLAMAGQTDEAMTHWRRAVEWGYGLYGNDQGWWKADPDLQPLMDLPAFWEIAQPLIGPQREDRGLSPDDTVKDTVKNTAVKDNALEGRAGVEEQQSHAAESGSETGHETGPVSGPDDASRGEGGG